MNRSPAEVSGFTKGAHQLGTPGNQLTFQSSEYPRPDTSIIERVQSGTVTVENSPPAGQFVKGQFEAVYEWLDGEMKPIRSCNLSGTFNFKRLT